MSVVQEDTLPILRQCLQYTHGPSHFAQSKIVNLDWVMFSHRLHWNEVVDKNVFPFFMPGIVLIKPVEICASIIFELNGMWSRNQIRPTKKL